VTAAMSNADDSPDLTIMQCTDPVYGAALGEQLLHVHPRSRCEGRGIPCCIHDPSEHHMRAWPMNWRSDTGVMERTCPHGTGHPDPDHLAYVRSLTPEHECIFNRDKSYAPGRRMDLDEQDGCPYPHLEWQAVHGCDGCC
jgi:hypothetical protein